jgi:hypothetical protein
MVQKRENLAKKIVQLRRALKDKTQEAFGNRFDPPIKRSTIAHWETGRSEPGPEQILKMAEFKGESGWWWKLYLSDWQVEPEDDVDYDQSGRRIRYTSARELEEMSMNSPTEEEMAGWLAEQNAPPKTGPLSVAMKLPAEQQIKAIRNILKSPDSEINRNLADPLNQGLGGLASALAYKIETEESANWERKTKNFKQAVVHILNKKLDSPSNFWDVTYKRGTIRAKADYCDGLSLVLIVNEQMKYKNEALARNLGKLMLLEKMSGNLLNKMLAICVDVENPKINHLMLDDISAASDMGITLTFVTPDEEDVLAREIIEFIQTNRENKTIKVKGSLNVSAGETLTIPSGQTIQIDK